MDGPTLDMDTLHMENDLQMLSQKQKLPQVLILNTGAMEAMAMDGPAMDMDTVYMENDS